MKYSCITSRHIVSNSRHKGIYKAEKFTTTNFGKVNTKADACWARAYSGISPCSKHFPATQIITNWDRRSGSWPSHARLRKKLPGTCWPCAKQGRTARSWLVTIGLKEAGNHHKEARVVWIRAKMHRSSPNKKKPLIKHNKKCFVGDTTSVQNTTKPIAWNSLCWKRKIKRKQEKKHNQAQPAVRRKTASPGLDREEQKAGC
jgi:hypothetical protein